MKIFMMSEIRMRKFWRMVEALMQGTHNVNLNISNSSLAKVSMLTQCFLTFLSPWRPLCLKNIDGSPIQN